MKSLFKKSIYAVLPLMMASCSHDWLDLKPTDGLDVTTAIKTYSDATAALVGIYDGIQEDETYYGARMFYYGDVRGDDMQSFRNTRSNPMYLMQYTRDDAQNIWTVPYNVIRRCNSLIQVIDADVITDATTEQLFKYKGQALAIRALAHFDLVRVYGKPYSMDNGASMGVPVVTETLQHTAKPGRSSVAEVYDQIEKDLLEAVELLEISEASENQSYTYTSLNSAYIHSLAVKALLSRVYLYKEDNEAALKYAQEVINSNAYSLWKTEEYGSMWERTGTSEHIFEIINKNQADWVDREALGYLMFSKGYNNIILTRDFMALMEENKNDVRNNLRIMHQDSITNNSKTAPRYYLNKYPGRIDNSPQDVRVNNIPVLRYSEVYLNGAEAALKSGNMAVAAELYNAIASRAISTTDAYTAKSTVTLEDILTERRKELVGEGHRFFDLMRNNLECVRFTESTDKGYHLSALRDPSIRFDNTYFRIILPLPKSECDANEVLRAQQNPGY